MFLRVVRLESAWLVTGELGEQEGDQRGEAESDHDEGDDPGQ